jgi:tetratricopeptide (TPR) repeat protein
MRRCAMKAHPPQGRRLRRGTAGPALAAALVLLTLALAFPAQAAKKSYGYEEDPVRLGNTALGEGRVEDARSLFQEAIDNEWKLDQARFGLAEVLRREDKCAEAEPLYRGAITERSESRNGRAYPEASAGLGLVLYQLGKPDEAQREFESALSTEKNLWNANYGMARILIDGKRYDDALPYLEKGKGLKGAAEGEDQYRHALALVQVAKDDFVEAEKNALLALTLNPSEAEYGTLVAQIYTERGAPTLAIDAYEKALATPGVVPTARVHQDLALLYEMEKRFNDALRHYRDAIQIDSTFAPAYKNSARLYTLAGQNDRAAQFYLRYTQLEPNDAEGWFGQAEAFTNLNSNRRALEAAEKAYALDENDPRIRLSLARATYLTNDLLRSERLYSSVSDTSLYKSGDYVKLAQIALSYKQLDRADTLLVRALDMDAANAEAYSAKGKYFLARQMPDSAVVNYEQAIELNPGSASSRINLGVAFLQLKRAADAAKSLRTAIAMNPDVAAAHVVLAQALVMADSSSAGLAEYRRAIEIDPKNAPAMRGAGLIYIKRGDYGQAETMLSKAVETDPKNADGWSNLGSAQAGLRKIDDAIASFQKALEVSPNHEGALRGLDALRKAKDASGGN